MRQWLVIGSALTALAGCTDNPLSPRTTPPSAAATPGTTLTEERAALNELTRVMALGLGTPGIRGELRDDLRNSRHTVEHKLELRAHLKDASGTHLVASIARAAGITSDSVLSLVARVRPLELYMPVAAQREAWTGGGDLIVVSQLREEDVPTGYTLAGAPVPLSLKTAPSMPAISIVPVETNFAKALPLSGFHNVNDKGGTAIGTLSPGKTCAIGQLECASRTVDQAASSDGVYLTESHLLDAMEPWTKGMPELELHVHGPQTKEANRNGEDLACISGDSYGLQFWDQNPNDWSASIGNGAPMVFSRSQFNAYQAKFPGEALHFIMWEDDNEACKVVTDKNMKSYLLEAAGAAAGAGLIATKIPMGVTVSWAAAGVAFVVDIIKNGANLIYGNDDTVGAVIDIRGTPQEASYPGQTHVVMNGASFNGTLKLEFVWASEANGRPYGYDVVPSTTWASLNQTGSQALSATVLDQYSSAIGGHPMSWRSDDPSIATIDDDGILHAAGGGNTVVRVRACDPTCMDRTVNVAITGPVASGPSYAYEEYATITGSVVNPQQGSYYYRWEYSSCTSAGCSSTYAGAGEGMDLTSTQVFVSRYDNWVSVRLTILTAPYGTVIGTAGWTVNGAGEYDGSACGGQIIC